MLHTMKRPSTTLALLLPTLLLVVGCSSQTPEERVADARSQYTVELNTWFPKVEEPAEPAADAEGEDAEGEETTDAEGDDATADADADAEGDDATAEGEVGEGEGEQGVGAEPGPATIFFDLVVYFEGENSLPGITLDISQADPFGNEKGSWRHYVELPKMINGQTEQISFEKEVDNFQDGDQFSVVLETALTPEERSEYREFAEAGQ